MRHFKSMIYLIGVYLFVSGVSASEKAVPPDKKDGKIIKGETESLKKLQEKLDQANLPTGEII